MEMQYNIIKSEQSSTEKIGMNHPGLTMLSSLAFEGTQESDSRA